MDFNLSTIKKSCWIFLLLGIAIRAWNLPSPVVDAMAPRQAQTADAIRSLLEEPGFQLDSNASWLGGKEARIVQELPLYNILTQGVYEVLDFAFYETKPPKREGADPILIDISARIVSIVFWVLFFLLAQCLWVNFLSDGETFWANLILVFSPLSVFFGQAVMPEMVFLALTTGFLVGVLKYAEKPAHWNLLTVFFCSLLASLIKLPAFSPLGMLAVAWIWRKRGFVFLLRPQHWVAAGLILAAVKGWGGYVTSVNFIAFPDWTAEKSLRLFLGDPVERFKLGLYVKVAGYVTAFILTPLGVFVAGAGLWQAARQRFLDVGFFILAWCISLVFYVLVWGTQTAGAHSYYNLPMLLPAAMLFGMGMNWTVWPRPKGEDCAELIRLFGWRKAAAAAIVVGVLIPMELMTLYLFREDRTLLIAAEWVRKNIPEGHIAGVKLNHSPYYIDYFHVPVVSYYSGRRCFVIGRTISDKAFFKGLKECDVIVETLSSDDDKFKKFAVAFKGASRPVDSLERARVAGFTPSKSGVSGLRIWRKSPSVSKNYDSQRNGAP